MQRKQSHIVLAFLLLANLFFTQLAAGFLHGDHSDRTETSHHVAGEQIEESHEDCFICSLDLFHEFYAQENPVFSFQNQFVSQEFIAYVSATKAADISSPGRSPPSI